MELDQGLSDYVKLKMVMLGGAGPTMDQLALLLLALSSVENEGVDRVICTPIGKVYLKGDENGINTTG